MRGQFSLAADARIVVDAVNLYLPLAAVARAVLDRPWWQRYAEGHRYFANCMSCGAEMKRACDPWTHEVGCRFSDADRRLDALEAATAQGGGS